MRKKRFSRGRKSGHKRNKGTYLVSRGGIQLAIVAMAVLSSCTFKLRLLPTTIDVNSLEYVTDSIDTIELWENLK